MQESSQFSIVMAPRNNNIQQSPYPELCGWK